MLSSFVEKKEITFHDLGIVTSYYLYAARDVMAWYWKHVDEDTKIVSELNDYISPIYLTNDANFVYKALEESAYETIKSFYVAQNETKKKTNQQDKKNQKNKTPHFNLAREKNASVLRSHKKKIQTRK